MKILKERLACDGLDVEVETDQGELVTWHFAGGKLPVDKEGKEVTVEAACQEIQDRVTARLSVAEDELDIQKAQLEQQVSQMEAQLATTKVQLSTVVTAIADKKKPPIIIKDVDEGKI